MQEQKGEGRGGGVEEAWVFCCSCMSLCVMQQLDGLRRQRDRLKEEFAVVMEARNKRQNLSTLETNKATLENKIRYAKREKQVQASLKAGLHMCTLQIGKAAVVWMAMGQLRSGL